MTFIQLIFLKRAITIMSITLAIYGVAFALTHHSTLSIAATLPLGFASWKIWQSRLRDIFRVKKFHCVIPGKLYRSGQISHIRIDDVLRKHGIRTVVDLTKYANACINQQAEQRAIAKLGIDGRRFEMSGDGTGHIAAIASAVATIHYALANNKPVLVHCAAGVQRTGHVIAAYLLLVAKVKPTAVFYHLEKLGWEAGRQDGWQTQMNQRMDILAVLLMHRCVITEVPKSIPQLPIERPQTQSFWPHSPQHLVANGSH